MAELRGKGGQPDESFHGERLSLPYHSQGTKEDNEEREEQRQLTVRCGTYQ